jgi:putative ABC transport system permease protein
MFLRLLADNFARRPRRKLLTAAALSLGMAVATAALSVSLDVGDRLAREFRSLGANLVVTPEADSLPLEIGGVDYRAANLGAYLPEADLPKVKTVFWRNNIIALAPMLEVEAQVSLASPDASTAVPHRALLIGTWGDHGLPLKDGSEFVTGVAKANPWWKTEGSWFADDAMQCVVGTRFAEDHGVKVGDTVDVSVDGRKGMTLKATGVLTSGGAEDDAVIVPLKIAQKLAGRPGQYRKLYVSALSKPEDDFARRDPKTMNPDELERWSCSPYVSSIAYSIRQVLPGSDVRVIRRVADGEGRVLTRVRTLLWLVTLAALLAAGLAVGASSAASVIERRTEIGLMKALGAGRATVGFLLAAEQLLLAWLGGGAGYALGLLLARFLGSRIFGAPPPPSLLVLGVVLALAAAVTLLGSALPLKRAANFDPAPILRGE